MSFGTKATQLVTMGLLSGCMSMQSQSVQDTVQTGTKPYVEAYIEYLGPSARWLAPSTWTLHVNARDLNHASLTVTPEFDGGAPVIDPAARLVEAPVAPAAAARGSAAAPHGDEHHAQAAPAGALDELKQAAHASSGAELKHAADAAVSGNSHEHAAAPASAPEQVKAAHASAPEQVTPARASLPELATAAHALPTEHAASHGSLGPAQPAASDHPADRHTASASPNGRALRDELAALGNSVQNAGETPYQGCLNPIRIRLIREDGALLERQGCRGSQGWSHTLSQSVSGFLAQRYGK